MNNQRTVLRVRNSIPLLCLISCRLKISAQIAYNYQAYPAIKQNLWIPTKTQTIPRNGQTPTLKKAIAREVFSLVQLSPRPSQIWHCVHETVCNSTMLLRIPQNHEQTVPPTFSSPSNQPIPTACLGSTYKHTSIHQPCHSSTLESSRWIAISQPKFPEKQKNWRNLCSKGVITVGG